MSAFMLLDTAPRVSVRFGGRNLRPERFPHTRYRGPDYTAPWVVLLYD